MRLVKRGDDFVVEPQTSDEAECLNGLVRAAETPIWRNVSIHPESNYDANRVAGRRQA